MTDSLLGQEPPIPARAEPASETASVSAAALRPGDRWQDYTIIEEVPEREGMFRASDVRSMEDVIIRVEAITEQTEWRRQAWERLVALSGVGLVAGLLAQEENGLRFEVFAKPEGESLRLWLGRSHLQISLVESVVRKVTQVLEALHEVGVVHLGMTLDQIFVRNEDHHVEIQIGGWEHATLTEQADLVPVAVNPYYAPPEAAGLFRHRPGPTLEAWDWWGLGRVVQELVLGKHVYGLIMERDVSGNPPQLRERAERLLLERDPTGLRAGAVERLPEETEPRVILLLRGLLTSCVAGRWRGPQVGLWLQGQKVSERYELSKDARLFEWRRQSFTLPDVAAYFSRPENFAEGVALLFPTEEGAAAENAAENLLAYLSGEVTCHDEWQKVRPILDLVGMAAWQAWPEDKRRRAVAGLVWAVLGGRIEPVGFCLPTGRIDRAGMEVLLSNLMPYDVLEWVGVLTVEPFLRMLSPHDSLAAVLLQQMAETAQAVFARAAQGNWIPADDTIGQVKVLVFALQSDAELRQHHAELRASYASNADAELARMLGLEEPKREELVLLAYTGERADDFGYIKHEEWNRLRGERLAEEAGRLAVGIGWRRLHSAMASAPALYGPWLVRAVFWGLPMALAFLAEAWVWAVSFPLLGAIFSVAAKARVSRLMQTRLGGGSWGWRDRLGRCLLEARQALGEKSGWAIPALVAEYRRVGDEILSLPVSPKPTLPKPLQGYPSLWVGAGLSLVLPLGFCALGLSEVGVPKIWKGNSPSVVETTPVPPVAVPTEPEPQQQADQAVLAKYPGPTREEGKIYELEKDGFGGRLRGPLLPWSWKKPDELPSLAVNAETVLTPQEAARVVVAGEMLLAAYPRLGLEVTLAVPLADSDGKAGSVLVLYHSGTHDLPDYRAYHLDALPRELGWYRLAGQDAIFLGLAPLAPK